MAENPGCAGAVYTESPPTLTAQSFGPTASQTVQPNQLQYVAARVVMLTLRGRLRHFPVAFSSFFEGPSLFAHKKRIVMASIVQR